MGKTFIQEYYHILKVPLAIILSPVILPVVGICQVYINCKECIKKS